MSEGPIGAEQVGERFAGSISVTGYTGATGPANPLLTSGPDHLLAIQLDPSIVTNAAQLSNALAVVLIDVGGNVLRTRDNGDGTSTLLTASG